MEKFHCSKKNISALILLLSGLFIIGCGAKIPKPLSDEDIKKLENAIAFEDTDMEKNEIGGEVTFDAGDVKINKDASDLVFVLSTDASASSNLNCQKGTELGSVKNGGEPGVIGSISENTAFEDGLHILLCLRNPEFKEKGPGGDPLPNTIYSGLKSVVVDNFEEPKEPEEVEEAGEMEAPPVVDETSSMSDQPEKMDVATVAEETIEIVLPVFDHTLFEYDKYAVTPKFERMISDKLAEAGNLSAVRIIVEGHADERGSNEYNLALGEKRADAVKQVLVKNGVSPDKITTVSYGEENPIDYGKTEAAYTANRRSVVIIGADSN